jgi:hypothetical protein
MNYIKARWAQLVRWACWNAWDYAVRRESDRRRWRGAAPMTDEEIEPGRRVVIANEARQILENVHFQQAFAAVDDLLEAQALACDPDNKDRAARIVIGKQLLQAIRREIIRKMDDGYMAEVQIAGIERKRGLLKFKR